MKFDALNVSAKVPNRSTKLDHNRGQAPCDFIRVISLAGKKVIICARGKRVSLHSAHLLLAQSVRARIAQSLTLASR